MSALFWESETLEFWGGGRCAPGFKNHSEVVRGSLKVVIGYQKIGVVNNPGLSPDQGGIEAETYSTIIAYAVNCKSYTR